MWGQSLHLRANEDTFREDESNTPGEGRTTGPGWPTDGRQAGGDGVYAPALGRILLYDCIPGDWLKYPMLYMW